MILNSDMLCACVCHYDTVRMDNRLSHLHMLNHKCISVITCMTDTNMLHDVTSLCSTLAVYDTGLTYVLCLHALDFTCCDCQFGRLLQLLTVCCCVKLGTDY